MRSLRAFVFAGIVWAGCTVQGLAGPQDQARNLEITPATGPLAGARVYGNSFALLIGVNEYSNLPKTLRLQYAVKDVEDLRAALVKSYGFPEANVKVLLDKDATLANIRAALGSMADSSRVKAEDRIFVYFSGHGQTVKLPTGGDMGFLLPSDAAVDLTNPTNAGPYLTTCLPMDAIWNYLASSPAKHSLLIADACYSGLLTARSRGLEALSEPALMALAAKRALQVITAGSSGEKSVENDQWGHGAFTYKLLEELNARAATPDVVFTASELHASLERSVANLTQGKQTPLMGNKDTEGQFLFVPIGGSVTGGSAAPAAAPEARTSILSASIGGLKALIALRDEQAEAIEAVRSRYYEEVRGLKIRGDDAAGRAKVGEVRSRYEPEALSHLDPTQKAALPVALADLSTLVRAGIPSSLVGELNLTAAQKAGIAAAVQKLDQRWLTIPDSERGKRSREFRDEARVATRQILSPEQISKLDDYQNAKSKVREDMSRSTAASQILIYSPRAVAAALRLSPDQMSSFITIQRGVRSRANRVPPESRAPGTSPSESARSAAVRDLQRILSPSQWDALPLAVEHISILISVGIPEDAVAELNLTVAQWTQLQDLGRKCVAAIRALPPGDMRSRGREIQRDTTARAMSILTPEQLDVLRRYRPQRPSTRDQSRTGKP